MHTLLQVNKSLWTHSTFCHILLPLPERPSHSHDAALRNLLSILQDEFRCHLVCSIHFDCGQSLSLPPLAPHGAVIIHLLCFSPSSPTTNSWEARALFLQLPTRVPEYLVCPCYKLWNEWAMTMLCVSDCNSIFKILVSEKTTDPLIQKIYPDYLT